MNILYPSKPSEIKMNIFDWEELVAEMLDVTDEQREDDDFLPNKFFDEFEIDFELAFHLASRLLLHTPTVKGALSGRLQHAFVSRKSPHILMKVEAD